MDSHSVILQQIWISMIVYSIPQHFSWFKNYIQISLIFKLFPDTSFTNAKTISAFVDTDLKL